MPRIPRGEIAGHAYHVLNRGNGGATIFHHDGDYRAFVNVLATACRMYPVQVLGFCVMPNHFHLVVQRAGHGALSPFMQWWMTSHVRRYHRQYGSHGHVWQGRFKSFPIQQDEHLLTVLCYVLNNPVRAKLVARAGEWPWSSLRYPQLIGGMSDLGLGDPAEWLDHSLQDDELDTLRICVNRQRPFGSGDWIAKMAETLGLESTMRPRGRPRKYQEK
jgi:putative transposase